MNKKGQALIEFILILPIILLMLISFFELFNIQREKIKLQNDLQTVYTLVKNYENTDSYENKENITIDIEDKNTYKILTVSKNIKISSPILKKIYNNTLQIKESLYY